ncbi:MAG TPA: urease accessory UreF family protein [Jatrophihabitans sp.]|jgi:urease accessory protein
MSEDDLIGHLSALQLADSAFPSGRYTLSYGLETAAENRQLTAEMLTGLLSDTVRLAVAPSDGVALACAHRAVGADGSVDGDLVRRADERLTAVKLAREAREASTRTGRALLRTASGIAARQPIRDYAARVDDGRAPGNHAVVLGLVSAVLGVPRLTAVAGDLYAFCAGWVAAAVRLGAIDHRIAQRVLHDVRGVTARAAQLSVDGDVTRIASCSPFLDVMSMRHEQAELRLFAS